MVSALYSDATRKRTCLRLDDIAKRLRTAHQWRAIKPLALEYLMDVKHWECRKNANKEDIVVMLLKQCITEDKIIIILDDRLAELTDGA